MILFLGDSFTWGQGLPIEKWLKEGKSLDYCNRLPPEYPSELYNYEDDNYRKQNHFPNLVAKHFNKSYVTKWGNGGSNQQSVFLLNNAWMQMDTNAVDFIVFQFTEVSRDLDLLRDGEYDGKVSFEEYIDNYIDKQIDKINSFCKNTLKKPWFAFSWNEEIGDKLEKNYPKNYVPLIIDGKEFNNFNDVFANHNEFMLCKIEGIHDGHFNSKGHEMIANSIIKKVNLFYHGNNK